MPGIIFLIIGIVIAANLLIGVILTFITAYIVYSKTLMRTEKRGNWGRDKCSEPGCIPLETMWERGINWKKGEEQYIKELSIKSKDGLKLVAEWFDYGFDKTVIILPGRRETLVYSYYYANPYKEAGVNVLVIDQRAHGLSEGKYSTCGVKEAEDVSLWMKYLHDELKQKEIVLHGVCVGTCCASIVATKYETDYLKAVILDSMFITYKEIYKNHFLESGHHLFPVYYEIWMWYRLLTKCKINDSSPEKYMPEFTLPTLFIWGKKDIYCFPEKSQVLFDRCASKDKQLEWFDEAEHSRVRLNDEKRYDNLIRAFLGRVA